MFTIVYVVKVCDMKWPSTNTDNIRQMYEEALCLCPAHFSLTSAFLLPLPTVAPCTWPWEVEKGTLLCPRPFLPFLCIHAAKFLK